MGNFNATEVGATTRTSQQLNLTGANGYRLQISNVTANLAATHVGAYSVIFNPSTAPLTIAGNVQQANGSTGTTTLQLDGTASSNLISNSDGQYACELNGTSVTSDRVNVTGTVAIDTKASLAVSLAGSLAGGQKYFIVVNDGGEAVSGTFASLAQNAVVGTYDGTVLKISYTGDFANSAISGGNDIVLYTDGGSSNAYPTWAANNSIGGRPFDDDFDNDGIANGVEYALGLNPTTSSQPPGVISGNTITFSKGPDAINNDDVSWIIETSTTLAAGSWTNEVNQLPTDNSATIAYTFTPGTPERKFARLKAVRVP